MAPTPRGVKDHFSLVNYYRMMVKKVLEAGILWLKLCVPTGDVITLDGQTYSRRNSRLGKLFRVNACSYGQFGARLAKP
jgi:hypothetical protein